MTRSPDDFFAHGTVPADVHRFSHSAMATRLEIYCLHAERKYAQQAARAAFDVVDRLEQELSRFVENSDISRINRLAAGDSVRVAACTMECLQIARQVFIETQGAFDISIGSGFENLELATGDFLVRAHASGVRLDLGGIGKGFVVDRMAEVLDDWEVDHALIHAGYSSVLALEPPPESLGWPLTLSTPGGNTILARIASRRQALGASGIRKRDHIKEPKSMMPIRDRTAAWVLIPSDHAKTISCPAQEGSSPAALADALATAFMVMSPQQIEAYCKDHAGMRIWLLEAPSGTDASFIHYG